MDHENSGYDLFPLVGKMLSLYNPNHPTTGLGDDWEQPWLRLRACHPLSHRHWFLLAWSSFGRSYCSAEPPSLLLTSRKQK